MQQCGFSNYAELLPGHYVYHWTIFIMCEVLENQGKQENMVLQNTALCVLKLSGIQSEHELIITYMVKKLLRAQLPERKRQLWTTRPHLQRNTMLA